jgi:hypothetical protein
MGEGIMEYLEVCSIGGCGMGEGVWCESGIWDSL